MADLAASTVKINDVESAQNAPMSEATIQKIGGAINHLLDLDIGTRVTLLEAAPVENTLTVSSGQFAPLITGTLFSITATGRPLLFIVNGGTVTGTTGQNPALKYSGGTIATLSVPSNGTHAVGASFKIITPVAGTYNFYLERVNSSGSTSTSGVQVLVITL